MKAHRIIATALASISMIAMPALAQENDGPKFKFSPAGRVLLDGAVFAPGHKAGFSDGVAIPDIRLGGKATYGNWMAKIDVGYSFGKIGLKDVYMQYSFNDYNLLRGGYFVHQFGLQSATSSSMKETFEAPITDTYMAGTGRNTGFMFMHYKGQFHATLSGIIGTKITERASDNGKVSLGAITRLLWRPLYSQNGSGNVAQVGMSAWYQSAFHKASANENGSVKVSPGFFDFSASYPTRVDNVTLLTTNIDDARGLVKLSPEFLLATGRVSLAGQYYYMNVNRKNAHHFASQGVYGVFRALLLGDSKYGYSAADGGLATPNPKTLELVASYNYTNASDSRAKIWGGITNDWSVSFNYYINKYMMCRLRWSYTNVRDASDVVSNHVNIIQARIQFKF